MALYSVIQSITVTTLYKQGANLTQRQFLFIDLIFIIPLAVTMSYTQAYHKVSKTKPTSSLVSTPVLTSILGQVVIQIIMQVIDVREVFFLKFSIDYNVICFMGTTLVSINIQTPYKCRR